MFINRDLNRIYISESIRSLALGMIDVFVPILLLTNGYSFAQVIWFYILMSVVHIAVSVPAGIIGAKIGYKYLIVASLPLMIVFLWLFKDIHAHGLAVSLFVLGLIREGSSTLYWVGRHSLLGFYTDKKKIGEQVGVGQILKSLAGIPAPLIGGLILSFGSVHALVACVGGLLTLSVVPLFSIREDWHDAHFSIKTVFSRLHMKNAPIFMVQGVDNVVSSDLVWPVYIYMFILIKYVALGLVNFLANALSLATNYIAGRLADGDYGKTMRLGAIADIALWIPSVVARTPLQIYIIDSTFSITNQFVQIPFSAVSYDIARENDFPQFIAFREMAIQSGKIVALAATLAIGSFEHAIYLGLLYPLGYIFFKFHRKN